ncbi:hypothetical protein AB0N05_03490 [Nocardia sp. NPDC051030]
MTTPTPDPTGGVDIGAILSTVFKFLSSGSTASYNPKSHKPKGRRSK